MSAVQPSFTDRWDIEELGQVDGAGVGEVVELGAAGESVRDDDGVALFDGPTTP